MGIGCGRRRGAGGPRLLHRPAARPHRARRPLGRHRRHHPGRRRSAATSKGSSEGFGTPLVVALAVQVGALVITGLVATRHSRACLLAGRSLLLPATAVGLLDVGADLALTVAIDAGPLAVVGPIASLDPVVSVLLAVAVAGERLGILQACGVALALIGTVLVATASLLRRPALWAPRKRFRTFTGASGQLVRPPSLLQLMLRKTTPGCPTVGSAA